jgi:hypothetical protein
MLRQLTRALTTKAVAEKIEAVLYYITRELDPYVRELATNINNFAGELTTTVAGVTTGKFEWGGKSDLTGHGAPGTTLDSYPVGSTYMDLDTGIIYTKVP